jgi:hypothetical protein
MQVNKAAGEIKYRKSKIGRTGDGMLEVTD